ADAEEALEGLVARRVGAPAVCLIAKGDRRTLAPTGRCPGSGNVGGGRGGRAGRAALASRPSSGQRFSSPSIGGAAAFPGPARRGARGGRGRSEYRSQWAHH